jgi:hypothetical protein
MRHAYILEITPDAKRFGNWVRVATLIIIGGGIAGCSLEDRNTDISGSHAEAARYAMELRLHAVGSPVTSAQTGNAIYIVTLPDSSSPSLTEQDIRALADRNLGHVSGSEIRFVYSHALKGFSASLSDTAVNILSANGFGVYPDEWVREAADVQPDPPSWALDRIDQRPRELNSRFVYPNTGSGVHIYVFDSGVRFSHREFDGPKGTRAKNYWDRFGTDGSDPRGHGTHVAGIIAGKTYGVAKDALIHSVRVADKTGWLNWESLIEGLDRVIEKHESPAIINLSVEARAAVRKAPVDEAVRRAVNSGIVVVVAAGNRSTDACLTSPAGEESAVTVAATDRNDDLYFDSNFGRCVDIVAPGVDIPSAWNTGDDITERESGTSMAAPYVSGVIALYLKAMFDRGKLPRPAAVVQWLQENATTVTNLPHDTPKILIYIPDSIRV